MGLDLLLGAVEYHTHPSDDVTNHSSVTGSTLTDALNTLLLGASLPDLWKADIASIRLVPFAQCNNGDDIGNYTTGVVYEFNAASVADDDGLLVLKPLDAGATGRWEKKFILVDTSLPQTLANKSFLNGDMLAELTATAWQVTKYEAALGTTTGGDFTSVCDNASLPVATNRLGGFTIKGNTTVGGSPVSSPVASIEAVASGTWTSGVNCATDLIFKTVATIAGGVLERVRIDSTGKVGIGLTPQYPLHILGTSPTLILQSTIADAATKVASIGCAHFTNAKEPVMGIYIVSSTSGGNRIDIGGGVVTNMNAVQSINYYTGVTNTTIGGLLRGGIDLAGNFIFGSQASASYFMSLNGNTARTIGMEAAVNNNTAPFNFTHQASNCITAGTADQAGGSHIFNSGIGKGTGGSTFIINTSVATTTGNTNIPITEAWRVTKGGNINTPLTRYQYMATSPTADTIGDVRFYATYVTTTSTFFIEKCTVANAAKGAGTWVAITSFAL